MVGMATKETRSQRARRRGRVLLGQATAALREARIAAGFSQAFVAKQLGRTQQFVSLLEANKVPELSLQNLSEWAGVFGLEPSLPLRKVGPPLRDKGHQALIARLTSILSASWTVRREMPFPNLGDMRSWDLFLRLGHQIVGVEAETRIRDIQALVRRMRERARDGGTDCIVLVLSDTVTNRQLVSELRDALGPEFGAGPGDLLRSLKTGTPLPGSGVILI